MQRYTTVTTGSSTLKDATNEAIRTWAERAEDTFYIIGSAVETASVSEDGKRIPEDYQCRS